MIENRLSIAVVGAGGVGGYIASKLIDADLADVTLYARGTHLEAIQKEGLQVIDVDKAFVVHPQTLPPEQLSHFDVIFIATKSYDFASACEQISDHVGEDSLIIPLANGVDHKRELGQYLQQGILCDGCVYVISHLKEAGVIFKKSPLFYLLFGSDQQSEKMQVLADLLNKSGLKSKLSQQIVYDCWKKYLFISSFATMTSYFDASMDSVMQKYPKIVTEVLAEIKSVANALEIPIDEEDIAKVIKQAENVPEGSKTSMQLDFEQGKKTELESLTGYIVNEGKSLGVKTSWMQKMYEQLDKKGK
ncbi:MAG: 2-dehydropantoate 2-reductase [Epsilonproteobacteria bacterium]|nr:2-dehydropantoate 2-reductase [Campylobacterota bacterium]